MSETKSGETIRLKLNRVGESYVDVPNDAKFVVDLDFTGKTTKELWNPVSNSYERYTLRILKVWVKQPNGSFRLEIWPCDEFGVHELMPENREQTAKPSPSESTAPATKEGVEG